MIEGLPPKSKEEIREAIHKMLEDAKKHSQSVTPPMTDSRRRRLAKRGAGMNTTICQKDTER